MRQIQSADVAADFPRLLSDVVRGETILIVEHGRPVARLVPAQGQQRPDVRTLLDEIVQLRATMSPIALADVMAARHDGHRV
jgi:prevent-host-death family protein